MRGFAPNLGVMQQSRRVRLAWRGRLSRVDALCLSGFALSLALPLLLTPLVPWLLGENPMLLEAIQGGLASLITAGAFARVGRAELWVAIAAPLLSTALDPFSWWIGRRYGPSLAASPRVNQRLKAGIARAEAAFARWGGWVIVVAYYLPVPNTLLYIVAGASGMSLLRFVLCDLAGTLLFIIPLVMAGYMIGQHAVEAATTISQYAGVSAVVLVGGILAYNLLRARWLASPERRPQAADLP